MTTPDHSPDGEIFERLDLSYSALAELLGESRQNVRQMIQGGRSPYFSLERLHRLFDHFDRTAPDPTRARYLRGLIEARLPLAPAGRSRLGEVTAGGWTALVASLPTLAGVERLLRPVQGDATVKTREIVIAVPAIDEAALERLKGVEVAVAARLTVLEWPVAALYPPLLLLDEGGGPWRAYGVDGEGLLPCGEVAASAAAGWRKRLARGEGVRLGGHPLPLACRGEPLAQARGAGTRRLEYRFPGEEGYTLLLEELSDWGWLLRLTGEGATAGGLVVEDAEGREWLRADGAHLPHQGLWPHAGVDPQRAAREGLFLRREPKRG